MGKSGKIRPIRVIRVRFWMEIFISDAFVKTEPQMNADERRFNVPGKRFSRKGECVWIREKAGSNL